MSDPVKHACAVILGLLISAVGCGEPGKVQNDSSIENSSVADRSETDPAVNESLPSNTAQQSADGPDETTYNGKSLSQWQSYIKNLDPESPEAFSAVDGLLKLVQERDLPWFTRRQAALKLAAIGPPARRAVAILIELLKDAENEEESTRMWAAKALAAFGSEAADAAPVLTDLLRDRSQPIEHRQVAIEALSILASSHPAAVPALIDVLEDRAGEARMASTLRQRYDFETLRQMAAEGIGVAGAPAASAIPALIRASRDGDETLRRKSIASIGVMGARAEIAIPALVERMVLDDTAAVRDAAANALAQIGVDSLPALEFLLKDDDPEVRWRAADSLGRIGRRAQPALPALGNRLTDESHLVRITVCEAMWNIRGDPEDFLPVLLDELTNADRPIRMRAYQLFIDMGPHAREAIEPLKKLLNDERGYVRTAAARVLETIETAE